jgi:hypothetical protein
MGRFSSSKHFNLGDIVQAVLKPSLTSLKITTDSNASVKTSDRVLSYCAAAEEEQIDRYQGDSIMIDRDTDNASSKVLPSTDEDFIDALGVVLVRRVERARLPGKSDRSSENSSIARRFHGSCVPSISICEYLRRIHKFFGCSDECFVIALVYIDRISKMKRLVPLCDLTVHRLLLIAMVTAAKFHDDNHYKNMYYAKVGGIGSTEVNKLEALFLRMLDWNLCVSGREYQLYHTLVNQSVYQLHERISL